MKKSCKIWIFMKRNLHLYLAAAAVFAAGICIGYGVGKVLFHKCCEIKSCGITLIATGISLFIVGIIFRIDHKQYMEFEREKELYKI
jgi:hypothetical protein